ncbi:hypothetical protein [Rhizobium sp. 007]|uniref:hypothetical protein n=1 Tax=Rhizobium sp. 007 TaxID=2785056 RepID=UPI001FF05E6A|nr:hypothetical protein [Rhizobium sp. 007]
MIDHLSHVNASSQSVVVDLHDIVASRYARTEIGWTGAQRTCSDDRHLSGIVAKPVLLFEAVRSVAVAVEPNGDSSIDEQLDEAGVEEIFVAGSARNIVMPARSKAPSGAGWASKRSAGCGKCGRLNRADAVHRVVSMTAIECQKAKAQVGKIEDVELLGRVEGISALPLVEALIHARELAEPTIVEFLVVNAKKLQFRP